MSTKETNAEKLLRVIIGISILVWITMYKTWTQRWMYLESKDESCEKNKEKQLYDLGNEQRMVGIMQAKRENKRNELQRKSQKAINTPVLSSNQKKKKKTYFVIYVWVFACLFVCVSWACTMMTEARRGGVSSRTELEITVSCQKALGNELMSCTRAKSTQSHLFSLMDLFLMTSKEAIFCYTNVI